MYLILSFEWWMLLCRLVWKRRRHYHLGKGKLLKAMETLASLCSLWSAHMVCSGDNCIFCQGSTCAPLIFMEKSTVEFLRDLLSLCSRPSHLQHVGHVSIVFPSNVDQTSAPLFESISNKWQHSLIFQSQFLEGKTRSGFSQDHLKHLYYFLQTSGSQTF